MDTKAQLVRNTDGDFARSLEAVLPYLGHQLRTPLAAILGSTEMMFDSQQPLKDRLRCLNNIRRNVTALTDLAEELGRRWEGFSEAHPSNQSIEFSFLPFISEIYETCRAQAWKNRLNLRIQFEGELPETVRADAKRLRQILCSVIGDTIELTERGEILVTFSAVLARDPKPHWKVLVSTYSFFPSPLPRVFQSREQRLSWWELLRNQAADLGAELLQPFPPHHRNQEASLSFPVGAVRELKFLKSVQEKDLQSAEETPAAQVNSHCLNGARILIVEDTREVQMLLSHLLERFGASVQVANDGITGLEAGLGQEFDFVLLDLELPIMNGYEVVKQLRRSKPNSQVFALTAHASESVRADCLTAGFSDYLTKPIHVNDLVYRLSAKWRH